jgi:hypothetical protein
MDAQTLTENELPGTLAELRQQTLDLRRSLAALLRIMDADGTARQWRMVVAEARAVLTGPQGALQPTDQATGYPATGLRDVLDLCPVCERRGWVLTLADGCTVTLHSEWAADGEPLINEACWTSE